MRRPCPPEVLRSGRYQGGGAQEGPRRPVGAIDSIALEAMQRIDALFPIERGINGRTAAERHAVRKAHSTPLMADLKTWLTAQGARLSRHHNLAKAINYMLRRGGTFTCILDDARVSLSNNATERPLRCVPLGRKAWLFCGSDHGGQRPAVIYTLIGSCQPADVLTRIAGHPASRFGDLLPWN